MYVQPYSFQQAFSNSTTVPKSSETKTSIEVNNRNKVAVEPKQYENPVSKTGEYFIAMNHSYKKSLKTAGKVFIEIVRLGGVGTSDDLGSFIAFTGLVGAGVGLGVFLFNFPKDMYEANVHFFTKSKEMDVYVRNNFAEQTIYEKLDTKVDKSNKEESDELYGQFIKVKAGHTAPSKLLLFG